MSEPQVYATGYSDPVNHPNHYAFGKIEVIDAIEDWKLNFNRGNAIKYIVRAGRKTPSHSGTITDLEKAMFYLSREIEAERYLIAEAELSSTPKGFDSIERYSTAG